MQIITIDDVDFPRLLSAFGDAKSVGRYWRNGQVQVVRITEHFVFVVSENIPGKIAIKPVRSMNDAETLGRQLLTREEQRGNRVELQR
ncbi:MAG: hypothetical protein J0M12_00395 [Deltaproteobacteria bacterium]|nr:hypothetical protein [Deltaproteobacteria bacterium]